MKLILVNGKKRSGKDYFAEVLQEKLYAAEKTSAVMSFADPIKKIIATTLNVSLEQLDDMKNEAEPIGINEPIYDGYDFKPLTNARSILQNFGTEAMKEFFGEDVWVNLLLKRANDLHVDYVIVPDFRFNIEALDGGITIKVRNDEIEKNCTDNHRSENELNEFSFDYTIDNTDYRDIADDVESLVKQLVKV